MKILYLHGWHSVQGGVKPTYLESHGHTVVQPKLDDDDFEAALQTAQREYDLHQPDVIVGSSRGGAVALNLRSEETPLVLLCPAWRKWGDAAALKINSVILHSRLDDVVPFADSELLVANSGLPAEALMEVGSDHRLADESSLAVLLWVCNLFDSKTDLPWLEIPLEDACNLPSSQTSSSPEETSYVCDACGEEIVIPFDVSEGTNQVYTEDCPVCCRANIIHVDIDDDGVAHAWAEPEQDYEDKN